MAVDGDIIGDHLHLDGVVLKLPPVPSEVLNITYNNEKIPDDMIREVPENLTLPFASSLLKNVHIVDARLLACDDDVKTIIELSLDNTEAKFNFKVGDSIAVLPGNDDSEVVFMLHRLKLSDKSHYGCAISLRELNSKRNSTIPKHLPQNENLKYILKHCIDIRSVLKKILICALSKYTIDESERRRLEEICSQQGSSLYNKHILEKRASILDLLRQYPSCDPPVTLLMQHLPRLMPRPYSICNTQLVDKNKIKICFSVLANVNERKGVATGWMEILAKKILASKNQHINGDISNELESINEKLNNLEINNEIPKECERKKNVIPVYLRKSTNFTLPFDLSLPIIMIGPGTGVAPFIGFLEERRQLKIDNSGKQLGPAWLYFGCRYYEKDFIYKRELNNFISDGTLTKLKVAHSREKDCEMKYVQDHLAADAKDLVALITEQSAVIFVCGDLITMGKQVEECFIRCFKTVQGIDETEAKSILAELKGNQRYIEDIWT